MIRRLTGHTKLVTHQARCTHRVRPGHGGNRMLQSFNKSGKQNHKKTTRTAGTVQVEMLESRMLLSASWFVSTAGSDAAVGTIDAPLATLRSAVSKAAPGDTISLRGGTYNLTGTVWVDKSDITIQSYAGETAKLVAPSTNSSIGNAIDIGGSNNIKLLNLDISGGYYYTLKADGGDNLLISGSKLHDSGADVVKLAPGTDYSVIEGSEIYNSGRRDGSNAEGVDAVGANYAVLRDSYIHDITTNGVYYKGGSVGTVIERNRVTRTGYSGIILGQSTDAVFFDASNPEHYENIDGIVRNNIVWDVGGAGVAAWAALRPQIYNNTLYNVAKTYFGGLLVQAEAGRASTDVTLLNNIVTVAGSRPALNIRAGGLTGSLVSDYNYFNSGSGSPQIWDDISGYYGGLAGWQSSGQDIHSYAGDPGVDAADGFHLTSTSGAIDRGTAISLVTDDFDRQSRPSGAAYDIGADEASTSMPIVPPTDPPVIQPIVGDLNSDGIVDGLDLSVLGSNWQRHGLRADGDLNNDGTVDGVDLSMLGANWQTGVKRLT